MYSSSTEVPTDILDLENVCVLLIYVYHVSCFQCCNRYLGLCISHCRGIPVNGWLLTEEFADPRVGVHMGGILLTDSLFAHVDYQYDSLPHGRRIHTCQLLRHLLVRRGALKLLLPTDKSYPIIGSQTREGPVLSCAPDAGGRCDPARRCS